jgi:glycosyltransferase involved in cell wall biosynthesis
LLAKKEIEKPLVVTLHGYDILVEESVGYGARLDRRADAIVRKVLSKADAVVTASHATYREAHKLGNLDARLHLIPEGVDTKRFRPDLDGDRIRERWGIEGKTVVFSLRKHEPKYGLEYVVRAAPSVVAEDNDVVFVMGGDGPLRPYLERLAETLGVRKRVIFTSWVPQEELPYYYAMSDLVVVPSVQEAFGLVVSEAMASGKPVIGTSVGGIPDQIVDGQDGLLVRPRDVGQLAASILELARDPQRRRLLGSNGRKEVESKFSIDRRVADMIKLYRSLV